MASTATSQGGRVPLTQRPLDLIYFIFFLTHIPASFLIDFQVIYPQGWVPKLIAGLPDWYIKFSNDPLIAGGMGYFGHPETYLWFHTFLYLEILFQIPTFIIGARALWTGSRSVYLLLLIYGASTATTLLPCLAVILATPATSATNIQEKVVSLSAEQRGLLLASYVPFLVIPLMMTVDMALRISKLVRAGIRAEDSRKAR